MRFSSASRRPLPFRAAETRWVAGAGAYLRVRPQLPFIYASSFQFERFARWRGAFHAPLSAPYMGLTHTRDRHITSFRPGRADRASHASSDFSRDDFHASFAQAAIESYFSYSKDHDTIAGREYRGRCDYSIARYRQPFEGADARPSSACAHRLSISISSRREMANFMMPLKAILF